MTEKKVFQEDEMSPPEIESWMPDFRYGYSFSDDGTGHLSRPYGTWINFYKYPFPTINCRAILKSPYGTIYQSLER